MARPVNTIVTQVDNSQAYREMERLRGEVQRVGDSFRGLQAAVAGIGIGAFVTQTLNATARIAELARSTGLSGQRIAEFQLAVRDSGATSEQAADAIASLVKKIGEARAGSTEAVSAFGAVGISMADLANLDSEQLFQQTLLGLKSIPDQANRSAAAIKLMEEAVKRVDFSTLNLNQYSQQAVVMSTVGEDVRQAQINMAQSLDVIREKILLMAAPIVKFIADMTDLGQSTREFINTAMDIAKWAAAALSLVAIFRVIRTLTVAFTAVATTVKDVGIAVVGFFKLLRDPVGMKALLENLRMLPGVGTKARAVLLAIGDGFKWVIDNGAKAAAIMAGFAGAVAKIAGIDWTPADLFDSGAEGELLNARIKEMNDMVAARRREIEESKRSQEEMKKTLSIQRQQQAAAQQQLQAYKLSIENAQRAIRAETELIMLGEANRTQRQMEIAATERYRDALANVEQQILKARAAQKGSAEAQSLGTLLDLRKKIMAEYDREIEAIGQLSASRVATERFERNRLFTVQKATEATNRYFTILDEANQVGVSLAQRQRMELEATADASARQQIATEENTRRQRLGAEEVNKIYAEARAGIDRITSAQQALNAATERFNVTMFGRQQTTEIDRQIESLRNMTQTIGLNELQRGFMDVDAAARQAARAAIDMEEIRIGENLDPARMQEYYRAAFANTQRLKDAMQENYEASRTFSAGWQQAMAEFQETSSNAALVARDFFNQMKGWGEDFASTIVDYFRTGRLEISKLVNDILADIARLTIRQTITQPLVNALSTGLGNINLFGGGTAPTAAGAPFQAPAGTGVGLRAPASGFNISGAFAKGGNAMAGKSYVVGERGREVFTPAVNGRVTPIAPQQPMVFNQTVNIDARSDVAAVRQAVKESSYIAQAEMARSMRTGAGR